MQRKPLMIQLIALGYLLSPFFFILQYFYFSGQPLSDTSTWQSILTPYKLSFIVLPPIIAFGIYRIRLWGWYLSLVHMLFLLGNNVLAFLVGSRTPPWAIIAFTLVTLTVLLTFVRNTVRAPYFNPRIRWWESKPRYAITLKVAVQNDRTQFQGETFNISEGGLFMASETPVTISEMFKLQISRNGETPVEAQGQVVWVNPPGQKLPQGFGFCFTELNANALGEIRRYIKDQRQVLKESAVYRG